MRSEFAELDFAPNRDGVGVRATTARALQHTTPPRRTDGDDPERAAFVNRLVCERRLFGGALRPDLKMIRRLRAKPDKIIVDVQAASPNS